MRRNSYPVMLTGLLHRGKLAHGSGRSAGISLSHSLRSAHAVGLAWRKRRPRKSCPVTSASRAAYTICCLLSAACSQSDMVTCARQANSHAGHLRNT
jgi:hypothetical protein